MKKFVHVSDYNTKGVPKKLNWDYANKTTMTANRITTSLLDTIDKTLIDKRINIDKFILNKEISVPLGLTKTGYNVYATLMKAGGDYTNSFGYFLYDITNPPKNINDIKRHYILIPNTKMLSLSSTDTAQLVVESDVVAPSLDNYQVVSRPDNVLKYGQAIGFFIIQNGWDPVACKVDTTKPIFYSLSFLNPNGNVQCAIVPWAPSPIRLFNLQLTMGWEDLSLDDPLCDRDYNDILISIEALSI
jgi:hypothetical protein